MSKETTKAFVDGINDVIDDDVTKIVINPDDLVGTDEEKAEIVRKAIQEQYPDLAKKYDADGGEYYSELVSKIDGKDPRAMRGQNGWFWNPEEFCIVVAPHGDFDEKEEFVAKSFKGTRIGLDDLKEIPGDDTIWAKAVAWHEGQHCNSSGHDLIEEVNADKVAVDNLRAEGHDDVAQAYIDYRILRTLETGGGADVHATGLALVLDGKIDNEADYKEASEHLKDSIYNAVAEELGVSPANVVFIKSTDPEEYVRAIEKAIERGEFKDDNKYVEAYAKAYVGAFRRQVKDVDLPKEEASLSSEAIGFESSAPDVSMESLNVEEVETTANFDAVSPEYEDQIYDIDEWCSIEDECVAEVGGGLVAMDGDFGVQHVEATEQRLDNIQPTIKGLDV